ncbi:MAG: hypothetical protein AB8F74_00685 [Saprospiraceae bacterium]
MFKHGYLLCFLFLFSSCLNDDDNILEIPDMQPLIGEATVALNDSAITFTAYAMQDQKENLIRIELDAWDEALGYNRNISFSNVPLKVGVVDSLFNYSSLVQPSRSYCYYTAAEEDAIYAFYDLVENLPTTYFEILEIDKKKNLVKGKFQITLSVEEGIDKNVGVLLEDTLRLVNGVFEAPLRN